MANTNKLEQLIKATKEDLGRKIDHLTSKLDEKDKKINELEAKITALEGSLIFNTNQYKLLERKLDDSEQYTRRTSLRISGIKPTENETAEDCLNKVKTAVASLGIQLQDCEFDRAHRIGRPTDQNGRQKERQVIVKFTTFRARTLVYRNRVKFSDRGNRTEGVSFYIDQTKRRFDLRKLAVDYVKSKPEVEYVFVDINCNLGVRLKNQTTQFFNSMEELVTIVG